MKAIAPMLAGWTNAPEKAEDFDSAMGKQLRNYSAGGWAFELKWDGYRLQAIKEGDDVRILFGRSANDVTTEFPEFVEAVRKIPVDCIIDGEAVVMRNGWPHFQDFQNRGSLNKAERAERLRFIAFDVLHFGTVNAMTAPYADRRKALEALVAPAAPTIVLGPSSTDGRKMWDFVLANRLEGLIAKPLNSRYLPGERGTWLKVKRLVTEEFVVVGFGHAIEGKRDGWFGSLYVAQPVEGGKLRMVGPVGTGFNDQQLADLTAQMSVIKRLNAPDSLLPEGRLTGVARDRMTYVEPVIWCKVQYSERTDDGWALRGPASFKGQIDGLTMKPEDYAGAPPAAGITLTAKTVETKPLPEPSDEIPADDLPVQPVARPLNGATREVFQTPGSSGMRNVSVVSAGSGNFYLTCDCAAGRFVWKGRQFNPCKHMKAVLADQLNGTVLVNGLFS